MKQEMIGWQWHQLDPMQIICTSLQITMPAPHRSFFAGSMLFLMLSQQCQSTKGKYMQIHNIIRCICVVFLSYSAETHTNVMIMKRNISKFPEKW